MESVGCHEESKTKTMVKYTMGVLCAAMVCAASAAGPEELSARAYSSNGATHGVVLFENAQLGYYINGSRDFERYVAGFRKAFPFTKDAPVRYRLFETTQFGEPYTLVDDSAKPADAAKPHSP